jgi:hypothetical protein
MLNVVKGAGHISDLPLRRNDNLLSLPFLVQIGSSQRRLLTQSRRSLLTYQNTSQTPTTSHQLILRAFATAPSPPETPVSPPSFLPLVQSL